MAANKDQLVTNSFRRYLLQVFWQRAQKNPSYSFRAFAKYLKIDASSLRKIVNGKRPLGEKVIRKLGQKLRVKEDEIENYVAREKIKSRGSVASEKIGAAPHRYLTVEEALSLCSWIPFAIIELMDVKGFRADEEWISSALQISREETRSSLDKLFQIGWLKKSTEGWVKCVGQTTSDPGNLRIKDARHALMREIARKSFEAVDKFPREIRAHSANTVAISTKRLPEALAKIQRFRMELADLLSDGEKDGVYQILVAVYPISVQPESAS